jgi:hypothetical protein
MGSLHFLDQTTLKSSLRLKIYADISKESCTNLEPHVVAQIMMARGEVTLRYVGSSSIEHKSITSTKENYLREWISTARCWLT